MTYALAAILSFFAPTQEKATVEDVLKLMESRTAKLKDATWQIEMGGQQGMMMGGAGIETRVHYLRGTGLRVHSAVPQGPNAGMSIVQSGAYDFIYDADALRIIMAVPDGPVAGVSCANLKVDYTDPALKGFDHYFLPVGFPIRLFFDEPLVYYILDPRFFFKLECNLSYEGRRTENGRECHVLSSWVTPSELTDKLGNAPFLFTRSRKEFFVDAENGRLLKIQWDVTVKQGMGGREREEVTTLTLEPRNFREVEGLALPGEVAWTFDSQRAGRGARRNESLIHTIKGFRANGGIAAELILTDAEKSDLYADAVLLGADEYAKRIEKNPKDARAHYSLGLVKADVSLTSEMMRRGGPGAVKPDLVAAAAAIEKAVELVPGAEAAMVNLFGLYRRNGAADKEKALLERIEKGDLKGERLIAMAAFRLNESGEHDRALKVIALAVKPAEPVRRLLALQRLFAFAGKKDETAFLAAFDDEGKARESSSEKLVLAREVLAMPDAVKKILTAEFCARTAGLTCKFALTILRGQEKEPDPRAEALTALAESEPGDAFVREYVLGEAEEMLGIAGMRDLMRIRGGGGAPEPPKAWGKEAAAKLVAAVTKESSGRAHLVAALALKAAGESPDAQLAKSLEACKKAPDAGIARTIFHLAGAKDDDAWTGECLELLLKVAPKGEAMTFDLIYDEQKNPVSKRLSSLVTQKKYVEAFRLFSRAEAYLTNAYRLMEQIQPSVAECAEAVAAEVMKEEKDPAVYKAYAGFANRYLRSEKAVEVMEKARSLWPKDVAIVGMLADEYRRGGQPAKAVETYESMIALLDKPVATDERTWSKTIVLLVIAEIHESSDKPRAKETLGRIELKGVEAGEALRMGGLYSRIEEYDLAIAAYQRASELGLKPNFQLGRLYEKKKDNYEALRYYNRDIAASSSQDDAGQRPPQPPQLEEIDPEQPKRVREPQNGQEAREALLKREGTDWIVERFQKQTFEALSDPEVVEAKRALAHLEGDDLGERDDAIVTLKKLGPRVTPLLKEKLAAAGETKDRLKKMVMEWAEPR